jgi:hypothetical protein
VTTLTPPSALGLAPTASVTLDEFMELSRILTDDVAELRDEVGAQYQAALDPAALKRLVQATVRAANPPKTFNDVLRSGALNDPVNAATTQQILTYWYTGLVGDRTCWPRTRSKRRSSCSCPTVAWESPILPTWWVGTSWTTRSSCRGAVR